MRTAFLLRQTKTGPESFTKVFAPVNKTTLREAIVRELRQELARQMDAAQMARDEAISEESRAENKWDTHSQEAAYLAEGQAKLAAEIRASIEVYNTLALPDFAAGDAIAIGAVVALQGAEGRTAWYFIGPRAGGLEIAAGDRSILVLTPQSPLGRQLLGRRQGDLVQVAARGGASTQTITAVQ